IVVVAGFGGGQWLGGRSAQSPHLANEGVEIEGGLARGRVAVHGGRVERDWGKVLGVIRGSHGGGENGHVGRERFDGRVKVVLKGARGGKVVGCWIVGEGEVGAGVEIGFVQSFDGFVT